MKKKWLVLYISLLICNHIVAQYAYPFLDPDKTVEERAGNIISLLTLDEKIKQMMKC